jgi:hypothetical protein
MTNWLDFHLFRQHDTGMPFNQMKYVQCLMQFFAVAASSPCPYSIHRLIFDLEMFEI